jgi:hypothetical protein
MRKKETEKTKRTTGSHPGLAPGTRERCRLLSEESLGDTQLSMNHETAHNV